MGAETLPEKEVAEFVEANFEACKVDPDKQEELAQALGTIWTPQVFIFAPDGPPVHETIGFMLPAELLAELAFALAKGAVKSGDYERASRLLREFGERHPAHERVPESRFWLGLSEWRGTGSFGGTKAVWRELVDKWPGTTWAARVKWELE